MPDVITSYRRFSSLIGSLEILIFDTSYLLHTLINFVKKTNENNCNVNVNPTVCNCML